MWPFRKSGELKNHIPDGERLRKNIQKNIGLLAIVLFLLVFGFQAKRKMSPGYGRVYYRLGNECQDQCSLNKQIRYFKKAVEYDPNLSKAHYRLANLYEQAGNQEKAVNSYEAVTRLDHTHNIAYFKVGFDYFQKGDADLALRYLKHAFKHRSTYSKFNDEIIYYLAGVYEAKDDLKKAIFYYEEAAERRYNYPKIYFMLNRLYLQSDAQYVALQQIKKLRTLKENDLADQLELEILAKNQ